MKYYLLIILVGIVSGCLILFCFGCAAPMREIYLDAGQKVKLTAPTSLKVWCNADHSYTVEADDWELNKNLIIE